MNEKEFLEKGYRKYGCADIDVFFNINICQHSGKCTRGMPSVFDLARKPWICLEEVDVKKLKATIDRCPSGALKYIEGK